MIRNIFKKNLIKYDGKILDKKQTKVVLNSSKSLLVIAGAGSGKSLTICAKINYLIKNGINENKIICISFTNETVKSLEESLLKNNIKTEVKTFHTFALSILKDSNLKVSPSNMLEYIVEEYFECLIDDNINVLYEEYLKDINLNNLKKLITSFINTLRSYNLNEEYLYNVIKKNIDIKDKILLIIIIKILIIYKEEKESSNMLDFEDMLIKATNKIDKINYFKYKYIIIDEFQDTSITRYNLIKKIIDKFDCNLLAVGDDYQSIYSFNGCNLDIFIKFKKYFNNSKIIKLNNTYRNSKDIVDISRLFILENHHQINKRLISHNYILSSINIVYSGASTDIERVIKDLDNILILGRNNRDIETIIDNDVFVKEDMYIKYKYSKEKKIRFMTVHESKGLEEDYVIVLNVVNDTLGFPNKIKEHDIYKYIRKKEDYLYAEERRIFYVALTRCKKKVFLFTNKINPSLFINELLKKYKHKINIIDFVK